MELQPHQKKALDELGNGKILRGGVGSGKTLVSVAYYLKREAPRDVFVLTTAKKRDSLDWEKEFAAMGIGKYQDATVHGVLTVDSWNNIANYKDVRDAFFIFDEQRVVGSGAWTKSFVKIAQANHWILLSATPGDTWLDYIPVFLANGFYKNRTQFLREHVIFSYHAKFPKVDRYIAAGKLVRHRNNILVEMPFERHTVRIINNVKVEYDADLLERVTEKRWNVFKEEPLRDIAELFAVARRVVNTDPSRLSSVRKLMEIHPRLIVFYNFNYELDMLRTLASSNEKSMLRSTSSEPSGPRSSSSTGRTSKRSTPSTPPNNDSERSARSTSSASDRGSEECQTNIPTELTPTPVCTECSTPSSNTQSPKRRQSSSSAEVATQPSAQSIGSSTHTPTNQITACGLKSGQPRSRRSENGLNGSESSTSFAIAEWNGHKHEPIPKTDRWVYLVQYVAGSEGWNCIETDAMVFYSPTYSFKNWAQAFGRIDRMNTPYTELHYYILQSDAWIDKAIRKALTTKRNFNESSFARKMGFKQEAT